MLADASGRSRTARDLLFRSVPERPVAKHHLAKVEVAGSIRVSRSKPSLRGRAWSAPCGRTGVRLARMRARPFAWPRAAAPLPRRPAPPRLRSETPIAARAPLASLRDALKKEEQGQYIPSDVWKWVNDRENIPLLLGVGHLERAKAVGPASGAQFRGAELLERARAAL